MKKSDVLTLSIFIILVVLISSLLIFNIYKNNQKDFIDRKIEYVFDNLTYNDVFEKGSKLFIQSIDLLNKEDVFVYEKDNNNIKYYAINGKTNYKRILNFEIVSNTFKSSEVDKYMTLKKIIRYKNNYYVEEYIKENTSNYIGSIITLDSYDIQYAYFKSVNYYCEAQEYVGILEKVPTYECISTNTNFKIIYEKNKLRINDLEEIRKIFQ